MNLSVVGGVAAIAAVLGIAWAVFRSSAKRTSSDLAEQATRLWKQTNEALQSRLDLIELENRELKVKLGVMEEKNKVLADQVTGTSAVQKLSEMMMAQFSEQSRQHTEIMKSLNDLLQLAGTKRREEVNT